MVGEGGVIGTLSDLRGQLLRLPLQIIREVD